MADNNSSVSIVAILVILLIAGAFVYFFVLSEKKAGTSPSAPETVTNVVQEPGTK